MTTLPTPSFVRQSEGVESRKLDSLSIVLPCFNEGPNVAAAIAEAHTCGESHAAAHEVIVVDDGSTDDTRSIAEASAAGTPVVRVVAHDRNRGYGAAVRSGIEASRSAWVLLTDGDLQFDLDELKLMTPMTREHDLIAGYRIDRADTPARRLAAHAWNRLMRRSFGVDVRDVDCAFKLVRGEAIRGLGLESDGAMISTELLVRAGHAELRIGQVGVHHRPRVAGAPSGGDPRVVRRAFAERRALLRELRSDHRGRVAQRSLDGMPSIS
jgi:glycosyltransferase involved in cell wall biosynthesis